MSMALANETRLELARFVNETAKLPPEEGARVVADVFELDGEDRILGAVRVAYLLTGVGGLPEDRVRKLLLLVHCSRGEKRLRDLKPYQRVAIAKSLRLWGSGVGR